MGLGHVENIHTPVPLQIKKSVSLISCGGNHSLLLLSDNSLVSFGKGDRGQLGHNEKSSRASPQRVDINLGDERIVEISCGFAYSMFVTDKHRLYVTGANEHGQLGIENNFQDSLSFVINPSLSEVDRVSCGYFHSAALLLNGDLSCWGSSEFGQTGHGTKEDISSPRIVEGLVGKRLKGVACGSFHTVAVTDLQNVYSWGRGSKGRLGVFTSNDHFVPRLVDSLLGKKKDKHKRIMILIYFCLIFCVYRKTYQGSFSRTLSYSCSYRIWITLHLG